MCACDVMASTGVLNGPDAAAAAVCDAGVLLRNGLVAEAVVDTAALLASVLMAAGLTGRSKQCETAKTVAKGKGG